MSYQHMSDIIKPDFESLALTHLEANIPPSANIDLHVMKAYKAGCDKIWTDHVEPLLSTVKRLQEENERYKEAIKQISEENYDDDDKKHHLYATIDRIKSYAQIVIDDLPTGPTVGNIEM